MANHVTFSGKLNFAPDIVQTKDGKNMASFHIGVYNGKDANGKAKYFNVKCKVFNDRTVEGLMNLTVPANVVVTGRMDYRTFTDKNGNNREAYEVNCDSVGVEL